MKIDWLLISWVFIAGMMTSAVYYSATMSKMEYEIYTPYTVLIVDPYTKQVWANDELVISDSKDFKQALTDLTIKLTDLSITLCPEHHIIGDLKSDSMYIVEQAGVEYDTIINNWRIQTDTTGLILFSNKWVYDVVPY